MLIPGVFSRCAFFAIGQVLALTFPFATTAGAAVTPAPQEFRQEIARKFTAADGAPSGPVPLIECPSGGPTRAFSGGQWYELRDGKWTVNAALKQVADDKFIFAGAEGRPVEVPLPWRDARQILRAANGLWVLGTNACWQVTLSGETIRVAWPREHSIWQLVGARDGRVLMGTSMGLFSVADAKARLVRIPDSAGRYWTSSDVLGVAFDSQDRLWFATRAGVGCQAQPNGEAKFYEGKDGLPWNDFTGAAAAPEGAIWFTTRLGVIRFDGKEWHYRQGPRWLPHDDVAQAAVDADGSVWFATAGGIGCLEFRKMTLSSKAEFYEQEIERYIKRTPFGYVAEAYLRIPGDKASADPQDSDNDGLWTAMYGASESFAYGATRSASAKERAKKAFDALRFLQKVTQGTEHSPPKGYVARTVRPVTWPDPNIGQVERDREQQREEPQWKVYEPRWPKSADGKWYWKSDTSSDELDGHYFFYPLYYEFCADTETERERVREVVRDLTDCIVTHNFQLVDHDGKHTRWGVFDPASLNLNPQWWVEKGLNSLSMLAYLAVAEYVTGDAKYGAISKELIEKYGYAQNAMYPKVHQGIGSGNQSDDEMAFMDFYGLLRYSKNDLLKRMIFFSFYQYWAEEVPEMNPFFNFAYAGSLRDGSGGVERAALKLWPDWHADSMATLYGFPLDRLDWSARNDHRLDVIKLPVLNSRDLAAPDPPNRRGLRVNGKVVPVENRQFNHWNTDPWHLDYRGNAHELAAGTVFLLPYYMGLYHGYIEKGK